MLDKFKLLSVNQLSAEIKLTEVWKSINVDKCPLQLEPYKSNLNPSESTRQLRPNLTRVFKDTARLKMSKNSFNIDAAKVWNMAPNEVRNATTLNSAKSEIKKHCKTLPI